MSQPERRRLWQPPFTLDLVWAILPFALVAIGFGVQPLKSWDYWWHIAFGRMVAVTGEMPMHAHWLYTMPADAPAYVQPWIAQLTLYRVHDTFGLHAVLLLRNLLAAFAFGLLGLWAGRRAGSAMTGAILALVASAFGFFTIAARSHLLAWPLFLLVMPLAYALRAGRVPVAALAAFPAVTALWANLHGTFPVTPVVCAAFAAAELVDRWRGGPAHPPRGPTFAMWAATCAASLAATLLNPRGWEVWGYLWMLSTNRELRETVSEWWPTTLSSPDFYGAFFWLLLLFALTLMWRHRARLDLADLFMLLWIALLTIPQARFMLWFALAFPIAVSPYLRASAPAAEAEPPARSAQAINLLVACVLALTALAVQPWGASHPLAAQVQAAPTRDRAPSLGLVQAETPIEAIALLQGRFAQTPRLFHDHRYPGYLLYELNVKPFEQVVFVDNRIELLPYEDWRRFDRIGAGQGWQAELDALQVDAIVTAYQTHPQLIAAVQAAPAWQCPYDDGSYVVCWRQQPLRTPVR